MKKKQIIFIIILTLSHLSYGLVLDIPENQQLENNWCWAGSSQSILQYYGHEISQYEIAEYGTEGANTWNWLWGESFNPTRKGIDMILAYFGEIVSLGYESSLTFSQIQDEIDALRPFVIRWGWDNGGGHFLVGSGYSGDYIFAMDPWIGEMTYSNYDWFCNGGNHTWTHTLVLETDINSIEFDNLPELKEHKILNYPNPFNPSTTGIGRSSITTIQYEINEPGFVNINIYNVKGRLVNTLVNSIQTKGTQSISWDGLDNRGNSVGSGLYLYKLYLNGKSYSMNKCLLIK